MAENQDSPTEDRDPLVIFMPSGRRGRVPRGTSLLETARQVGVEIESICGGRLICGKCKVQIESGSFQKHGIESREEHVTIPSSEEAEFLSQRSFQGCRLSCSAYVEGDLLVNVPEESQAQKQLIRKSATERVIELHPAVRQVYVEVAEAHLEDFRGDWERLQAALQEEWELRDLRIDYSVLKDLQKTLREERWAVTVTVWQEREVLDVRPGYQEGAYGLAVDVGSTTVAGHLCDLRTGEVLVTESMMNPQVTYGEDLMSRVSYAMTHGGGVAKMHQAIIKALNQLAGRAAVQAGIKVSDIYEAVLVGNTVMHHLFLGIDPVELGGAPFALTTHEAVDVKARDLGLKLHRAANVHVLPCIAGHVGADNVGVMIAEAPDKQDAAMLVVDIGTNAEILLGNRERVLSASSPTGPAFEGAQITHGMRAAPGAIERVRIDPETLEPRFKVIGDERWSNQWHQGEQGEGPRQQLAAGICGSGIIEAIAEMYLAGILLRDGLFNANCQSSRLGWRGRAGEYMLATPAETTSGEPILITQTDVRAVQLAKAALYAGTKILMERAGIHKVDKVSLAGAFGSYIDPKYAMVLGLIPDCDLREVHAVGNAAGDGARIALLNREKRREARRIARWIEYVETAVAPSFQEQFVQAMHIPHARDAFPQLKDILPESVDSPNGRSRRHRRRRER